MTKSKSKLILHLFPPILAILIPKKEGDHNYYAKMFFLYITVEK